MSAVTLMMSAGLVMAAVSLMGCSESTEPGAGGEPLSSSGSLAEQQAEHGWGPDQCPALPDGVDRGFLLGDQLGALSLPDCDDQAIDLEALCGADVLWLSIAHAWCPHCRENANNMEALRHELTDEGHAVAGLSILIAGNGLDDPADAALCASWREQYAHDRVLTLYDPNENTQPLFEMSFTALNVFIDNQRLIQSKIHTDHEDEIEAALRAALP